jgi:hypothetical protein
MFASSAENDSKSQGKGDNSNIVPSNFSDINKFSKDRFDEESRNYSENYCNICNSMIRNINNDNVSDEVKVYSCYILRIYRYEGAASDLCRIIDLKAKNIDKHKKIARWGEYPAQEALTSIGKNAIGYSIAALSNESNQTRRDLFCRTLVQVEGKKFARELIKDEIEKETNSEKIGKLEDALRSKEIIIK